MDKHIDPKHTALIKKYVSLRGNGQVEFVEEDFMQAYREATPMDRGQFIDEMRLYIKEIELKTVQPGERPR